jgi:hypothetical protein
MLGYFATTKSERIKARRAALERLVIRSTTA